MIRVVLALFLLALPAHAATAIREIVSPGGIRAWVVEERSIPILSIEISFEGGASLDPADRPGAANLMAALLTEGAGERDAVAFAEAVEAAALRLGASAGQDSLRVSATLLTANRDASLALLGDVLARPRFDAEPMERVRAQVLSGIRSDATDPDSIASARFAALAFPGDPYGRPLEGTEASVAALVTEDLRAAHRALLVRSRARIGLVGDISAEEAGPLLDALLGPLPETGPPLPPPVVPALTGGVSIVDFETPQSVVIFAQKGVAREDPDFFAAYVLNHILGGGGFSSRLTEEVREKRGLTYGVYSYLSGRDRADLWVGGVASANDRVAEALAVIRAEWARMAAEGVTAEELDAAKRYLTGAWPLRFDSNGKIANILVGVQEEGLSPDYVMRRNAYVEAVTVEDIARVARNRLDAAALRFVVVGRPEGLAADE